MTERDYCGCCGCEIPPKDLGSMWCGRCESHVLHPDKRFIPWADRTYLAQHGKPCPYQVGEKPSR